MTSKQGPAFGLWRACRGRTAGRPFHRKTGRARRRARWRVDPAGRREAPRSRASSVPGRRPSIRPFPGVPTLIRSNPSRCRSSGDHVDSDIPIPFSSRIGGPVPLRRTRRCRPSIQAGRSDSVVTWSPAQGSIRTHLRWRDPQRSGLGPPSLPSSTPSMSSATHQHCRPASIVVTILCGTKFATRHQQAARGTRCTGGVSGPGVCPANSAASAATPCHAAVPMSGN